jgi:Uma2 family endonuclease
MSVTMEVYVDPERSYEIVNGKPEEKEMPGARHGAVGARLTGKFAAYIENHPLGEIFIETNFKIGINERIPDIAFVAAARIPPEGIPEGAWGIPPDLAVEIISPNDLQEKVTGKVLEYLEAGVRQVWLVSPEHRTVTIYQSLTDVQVFDEDDELVSEDLLPGFRCSLKELFPSR